MLTDHIFNFYLSERVIKAKFFTSSV